MMGRMSADHHSFLIGQRAGKLGEALLWLVTLELSQPTAGHTQPVIITLPEQRGEDASCIKTEERFEFSAATR